MNPPSSRDETTPPEHYMPQSSSSSSSSAAAAAGGGRGGSLYLDAYEVSFPLEESIERPPAYHINQGQQMMDEPVAPELPHSQYSPFILVSNLRAHLYVALEKNAWLQKRIEELEEERNFLRCQLDRFIVSMRTPEGLCSSSGLIIPAHKTITVQTLHVCGSPMVEQAQSGGVSLCVQESDLCRDHLLS